MTVGEGTRRKNREAVAREMADALGTADPHVPGDDPPKDPPKDPPADPLATMLADAGKPMEGAILADALGTDESADPDNGSVPPVETAS